MKLPNDINEENMNVSTQRCRDNGSSRYGFTTCAGVCCIENRILKSITNMNGIMTVKNSVEVVERSPFMASERAIAMPIRYIITKPVAIAVNTFANLFSSELRLRRSSSLRCFRSKRIACHVVMLWCIDILSTFFIFLDCLLFSQVCATQVKHYRKSMSSAVGHSLELNENIASDNFFDEKLLMDIEYHLPPCFIFTFEGMLVLESIVIYIS